SIPTPRSYLRGPGGAPPRGLHVLTGEQLARTLSGLIRAFVQRTAATVVSLRSTLLVGRILGVLDLPCRRIISAQQWQVSGVTCSRAQRCKRRQRRPQYQSLNELPTRRIVVRAHRVTSPLSAEGMSQRGHEPVRVRQCRLQVDGGPAQNGSDGSRADVPHA